MSENLSHSDSDDLLIGMVDVPSCEICKDFTPKRVSYFLNLCFVKNLPIEIHVHGIYRKYNSASPNVPIDLKFEEEDRELAIWAIKMTEKHVPV